MVKVKSPVLPTETSGTLTEPETGEAQPPSPRRGILIVGISWAVIFKAAFDTPTRFVLKVIQNLVVLPGATKGDVFGATLYSAESVPEINVEYAEDTSPEFVTVIQSVESLFPFAGIITPLKSD